MGNEGSSMLKDENVARRSGAALGVDKGTKYATRQKQALKDLQKSRDDLKSGRVHKETKLKKMEQEQSWDKLADAVNDVFVAPLQKMTGMYSCTGKHCEEEEEQYVRQYVPAQPNAPSKTVKQKVREMVREAHKEKARQAREYMTSDDEENE